MLKQGLYQKIALPVVFYLIASNSTGLTAPAPNMDAGTVLRDLQHTERVLPDRESPQVKVEQEIKAPMVQNDSFKTFVKAYRITGQDIISENELLPILIPYTNQELDLTGLQQAVNQITKHFRDKGYFVAQAYLPVQEIEDGHVEIAVIVGRCGEIILKNQTAVSDYVIKEQLSSIRSGDYIESGILERAALLAGDLPGVSAQATLVPGKQPGTSDIIVEAKPKGNAWQGSVSGTNWGNRLTGYNQGSINLNLNNPLKKGDSLTAGLTNSGPGLNAGNIDYRLYLGEGSTLNLGYSKVYYELGKDMSDLQANGTAYTTHADWSYAWQRSRSSSIFVQLGYDHKRLEDRVDLNSELTQKKSHAVSLGINGFSYDTFGGGGSNSYSLMHYKGSISGTTTNAGTTLALGDYTKTTYSFMRQQYLKERLSMFLSLNGQMASTNLDSSEKISLGGANGVRAYPSSEASGDEGWLGTVELRYNMPASDKNALWQLAAFYDTGTSYGEKVPTQNTTPNRRSLSGAGTSVSYLMPGSYLIKATYAWRTCSETSQSDTTFGKDRLWLQAVKYF